VTDVLPEWAVRILAAAKREKFTGWLSFNLRAGDLRHIKAEQVHFPPPESGRAVPDCPRGCGPMEARDRGTLFTCECGAKQTLAQTHARHA